MLDPAPSAERGHFQGRAATACIPHKGCSLDHQPLLFQPSKSFSACLLPQVQAGTCRCAVCGKLYLRREQRGCSGRRDLQQRLEMYRGIYHQKQLVQPLSSSLLLLSFLMKAKNARTEPCLGWSFLSGGVLDEPHAWSPAEGRSALWYPGHQPLPCNMMPTHPHRHIHR